MARTTEEIIAHADELASVLRTISRKPVMKPGVAANDAEVERGLTEGVRAASMGWAVVATDRRSSWRFWASHLASLL
jgi:hypothetical protein